MSNGSNLPNLSLIDACLGYLIKHPEIDQTPLPQDLHDHLAARSIDPTYRIKPPYNRSFEREVTHNIKRSLNQYTKKETATEQVRLTIVLFTYICEHAHFVHYNSDFARLVRSKLRHLAFHNSKARSYFQEWQQFHRRLFGVSIHLSPPQYSDGLSQLNSMSLSSESTTSSSGSPGSPESPDPTGTPITNDQIELRPLVESDTEALFAMVHESELKELLPCLLTRLSVQHFIHLSHQNRHCGKNWIMGIVQVSTRRLIGLIGLSQLDLDESRARVSYWIDSSIQEQKLGCQALRLFCSRAQELLNLERLDIVIDLMNIFTKDMVRRAGFSNEGTLWHYQTNASGYHDVVIYARPIHPASVEDDDDDDDDIDVEDDEWSGDEWSDDDDDVVDVVVVDEEDEPVI
jgi:RimJ/RimL family protein N-acetyltransferase